MYIIFLITVEQTIRYVGSLSKGTAWSRIAWTSDFDSWDLLCHSREHQAQQATRTSHRLAKTEELCKLQKGVTSYRTCHGATTCGSNSEIREK